jgi:multidrug resistance efflux pump
LQTQAQVKQTEAEIKLARINRDRYAQLIKEGAINQQQFDQAQTTLETAIATLEARQAAVNAGREQFINCDYRSISGDRIRDNYF